MATHPRKAVPGGPGRGRPTLYRAWYADLIQAMTTEGFSLDEIAAVLGVSPRTLTKWRQRKKFLGLEPAIARGRFIAKGRQIVDGGTRFRDKTRGGPRADDKALRENLFTDDPEARSRYEKTLKERRFAEVRRRVGGREARLLDELNWERWNANRAAAETLRHSAVAPQPGAEPVFTPSAQKLPEVDDDQHDDSPIPLLDPLRGW